MMLILNIQILVHLKKEIHYLIRQGELGRRTSSSTDPEEDSEEDARDDEGSRDRSIICKSSKLSIVKSKTHDGKQKIFPEADRKKED